MFDMVMTYTDTKPSPTGGYEGVSVQTVYRDRAKKVAVTHTSIRRGGCLYSGEITILDQNTGANFSFDTTMSPTNDDHEGTRKMFAALAERHWSKLK